MRRQPRCLDVRGQLHGGAVTQRNGVMRLNEALNLHPRPFRFSNTHLGGAFSALRAMGGEVAGAKRGAALHFRTAER